MADMSSTAHLCATVTQLAYTETQMAINPQPPFSIGDRAALMNQATGVANCAAAFRQKNAASINQPELFAAQNKVNSALAMFGVINNQVANGLTTAVVTGAVLAAEQAIIAL